MKLSAIATLLALTSAVVAAPGYSRRSLADTSQALARRQVPGGVTLDEQDDPPSAGSVICQLLKEEPLKTVLQVTTNLWNDLQQDSNVSPEIKDLGDVFKTIAGDMQIAGKQSLFNVKKALTKNGGRLGKAVVAEIDDAVEKFESAIPMIFLEVAACVAEIQEEQPSD